MKIKTKRMSREMMREMIFGLSLAGMVSMTFALEVPHARAQQSVERDDASTCNELTQLAERTRRFPTGLLYAIARVESGRSAAGSGASAPWPWTVTAEGEGRYYDSKKQAVRAVEQLQRDGITNIDVGCMQVNLFHHGRAFRSVSEALDPVNNVAYATEYLVVLYKRYRNWEEAVKHYHSSDPTKHDYYLARVKRLWDQARAPRSGGTPVRAKKVQKDNTPALSRDEASQLEREALLLSDGLRKKLGIVEQLLQQETETSSPLATPPNSAQNLNAGFFLDLIEEPL